MGLRVANSMVFNQFRVYHERLYADKVVSKRWFVTFFSSQHHSNFFSNIVYGNVSQVCTKQCKARFFCKVNLNFFSSSRLYNGDAPFAVMVFLLNESAHGFNNIRNGEVGTGFQLVKFWRLWNFSNQKTWTFTLWHFGTLTGRIVQKMPSPLDLPHSTGAVENL